MVYSGILKLVFENVVLRFTRLGDYFKIVVFFNENKNDLIIYLKNPKMLNSVNTKNKFSFKYDNPG